jgi:hypothetical protein
MASEAKITEHTLVPLSLIIAIGTSLIGGVVWLSALWYREEANARAIIKIEKKQIILYRICRDMQEIKGALQLPRGDACDPNAYEN